MEYLIGDVQGCCSALEQLLAQIGFSASRDRIFLLGDLVNRGPRSLPTLRLLRELGGAATCLLGNHDLHLLAVAEGIRPEKRGDTMAEILHAPDRDTLLDWLRRQRMACFEHGWLMVHAGVVPQWDLATTLALAGEVERTLQGPDLPGFLQVMYGNEPAQWSPGLSGHDRLRFTVNVLTRIRFCDTDGRLELKTKGESADPPAVPGHRLRLGRPAHRRAHRRRPPRGVPGALRAGAEARRLSAQRSGASGPAVSRQHARGRPRCPYRMPPCTAARAAAPEAWGSGLTQQS
jgi:bis(5'-nucleosyl)-tetraphosphatase (symmetrical)